MSQETQPSGDAAQNAAEANRPIVLELRQLSFRGRSEHGIRLNRVDLQLCEGELGLISVNAATRTRELTSMIQGLVPPSEGKVVFCQREWSGDDYMRLFRMRSRIGRVFEGQAWIENLNLEENVTLAARHHGASSAVVAEQVRYWTPRLGLRGLSRKRPAFVEPSISQAHQWVRALLGSPRLLLLERPLQFLSAEWMPKLVAAIDEVRSRGAAVLCFANDSDSLSSAAFAAPRSRWKLENQHLQRVEEANDAGPGGLPS